jgi:hypothetical protein
MNCTKVENWKLSTNSSRIRSNVKKYTIWKKEGMICETDTIDHEKEN